MSRFKTFFLFVFTGCIVFIFAQSASAASNTTLYEGTIGKYPVVMWYSACEPKPNVRCNASVGQYRYVNYPKLRLVIEKQSENTWVEKNYSNSASMEFDPANAEITGKWAVKLGKDQIKGTWTSVNGKKKYPILLKKKSTVRGKSVDYFAQEWNAKQANQFFNQHLVISNANNKGFQYEIQAHSGANSGAITGFATWTDNQHAIDRSCKKKKCVFDNVMSDDYEVKFTFDKDSLTITSKNTNQFAGHNVSFDGELKPGPVRIANVVRDFFGNEAEAFCAAVTQERCDFANQTMATEIKFSDDPDLKKFTAITGKSGWMPGAAFDHVSIVKDEHVHSEKPYYYMIHNFEVYTNDPRQEVTDWMVAVVQAQDPEITKADFLFHVTK